VDLALVFRYNSQCLDMGHMHHSSSASNASFYSKCIQRLDEVERLNSGQLWKRSKSFVLESVLGDKPTSGLPRLSYYSI